MSKQKWITSVASPIIAALFLAGVGFGVRAIVFSQKQSSLVDAVPKEADLWILVRGGLTAHVEHSLAIGGIAQTVLEVIKNQKQEIVVYRENGRWFKVTGNARGVRHTDGALSTLLENEEAQVVGFLSAAHMQNVFGPYASILRASTPYYFALREKADALVAFFIQKGATNHGKVAEYAYSFPGEGMVIKSADTAFVSAVREQTAKNLGERVAFMHPVVVSTQLPDKTSIQEKVVKPELFRWQEISPHRYQLVLDETAVAAYKVADQLTDFRTAGGYYFSDDIFIAGEGAAIEAILAEQGILAHPSFLYVPLVYEGEITTVDMLGKSEALSWLHDLGARSIMIVEEEEGFYGEMRF